VRVRFWGVRGSLPSPLLPSQVRDKLSEILRQALPGDFVDSKSKRRFLEGLPPWLLGTVGANTSCLSVGIDGFDEHIVFDCGSGMRELGVSPVSQYSKYHVFLSHFHWDHLQGFPFFVPAFKPTVDIDFYSPKPGFDKYLMDMMQEPYHPIRMEYMASKKTFHVLESPVEVGPATVSYRKMSHPGDAFAYKVSHGGKSFIYATDAELDAGDFIKNEENIAFFEGVDVAVVDSQYTPLEAIEKYKWGHSPYNMVVEFAVNWGIKHLVLFHHDPTSDDKKLYEMLRSSRQYLSLIFGEGIDISLACEGMEIIL